MENDIDLKGCFELQISESEMLNSMYPGNDEFTVLFPSVLADMNRFVSGESKYTPNQLDFTLNLKIPDIEDKLEVNVSFPHEYPVLKPEIYVRSVVLNRSLQGQLNTAMMDYIESLPSGDLFILLVIDWLMENVGHYISVNYQRENKEVKKSDCVRDALCRMWIYSHHIYNKFKRREIVACGEDLNLTGFSLPGKPGFICIEGYKKECNEFLQHLKQMSWKKISLVREETEESNIHIEQFRKFDNFSEISFQVRRGPAKEYHMDMGQFLKFLTEHNCAYAFQDLFGIEGQTSSEK